MTWRMQAILFITGIVTVCCQIGDDGYTDENRPYYFEFNFHNYQHRQEKKDREGNIMGEFGFITADGVYHITMYAASKDGEYKILSTKNIKIHNRNERQDDKIGEETRKKQTNRKNASSVQMLDNKQRSIHTGMLGSQHFQKREQSSQQMRIPDSGQRKQPDPLSLYEHTGRLSGKEGFGYSRQTRQPDRSKTIGHRFQKNDVKYHPRSFQSDQETNTRHQKEHRDPALSNYAHEKEDNYRKMAEIVRNNEKISKYVFLGYEKQIGQEMKPVLPEYTKQHKPTRQSSLPNYTDNYEKSRSILPKYEEHDQDHNSDLPEYAGQALKNTQELSNLRVLSTDVRQNLRLGQSLVQKKASQSKLPNREIEQDQRWNPLLRNYAGKQIQRSHSPIQNNAEIHHHHQSQTIWPKHAGGKVPRGEMILPGYSRQQERAVLSGKRRDPRKLSEPEKSKKYEPKRKGSFVELLHASSFNINIIRISNVTLEL